MNEHVEILKYEDTDDGGALINISLSPEMNKALVEEGFIAVLKRSIEQETLDFHRKEIDEQE
jgi:hypothetical protein